MQIIFHTIKLNMNMNNRSGRSKESSNFGLLAPTKLFAGLRSVFNVCLKPQKYFSQSTYSSTINPLRKKKNMLTVLGEVHSTKGEKRNDCCPGVRIISLWSVKWFEKQSDFPQWFNFCM